MLVRVMELHAEGLEPAQHSETDAAGGDSADTHPFEVIGTLNGISDIPAAPDDPAISRDVVTNERQDHHHYVLGDADRIGEGDLSDRDAFIHGGLEIYMVGANARRDNEFKFLRFLETLPCQVCRPERLRNNHLGIWKLFVQHRVLAILARGNDERVTGFLEKLTKSELPRDAAQ